MQSRPVCCTWVKPLCDRDNEAGNAGVQVTSTGIIKHRQARVTQLALDLVEHRRVDRGVVDRRDPHKIGQLA